MAITAEDGTGVPGAETYCTLAAATAYWGKRTHTAFYTAWNASTDPLREGALREATGYIDGAWGPFFKGQRRGRVQGLLWPRTGAQDEAGYELPGLPAELQNATAELAARALSARLADDLDRGGAVKRERIEGAVEVEYFEGAQAGTSYGVIGNLLAPLLNGSQPMAPNPRWAWA